MENVSQERRGHLYCAGTARANRTMRRWRGMALVAVTCVLLEGWAVPVRAQSDPWTSTSDRVEASVLAQQVVPNAADVAVLLQAALLPMAPVASYPPDIDPDGLLGKPNQYTSKKTFYDTRIGQPDDSSVEVFATTSDRVQRVATIQSAIAAFAQPPEFDYPAGPVLLRVTGRLSADQADTYRTSLASILPQYLQQ